MDKLFLFVSGVVLGLALSQSTIGAQMADLVQQSIHFLVG
jgi:hypothetical protein